MITIDGTEYTEEQLTDTQKYLVAQVQDIQGKVQNLQFQLDQLNVAKDAFSNQIVTSVREAQEAEAESGSDEPTTEVAADPATAAQ